jgi:hypothetical protein
VTIARSEGEKDCWEEDGEQEKLFLSPPIVERVIQLYAVVLDHTPAGARRTHRRLGLFLSDLLLLARPVETRTGQQYHVRIQGPYLGQVPQILAQLPHCLLLLLLALFTDSFVERVIVDGDSGATSSVSQTSSNNDTVGRPMAICRKCGSRKVLVITKQLRRADILCVQQKRKASFFSLRLDTERARVPLRFGRARIVDTRLASIAKKKREGNGIAH